jgi:hypothetical protein
MSSIAGKASDGAMVVTMEWEGVSAFPFLHVVS